MRGRAPSAQVKANRAQVGIFRQKGPGLYYVGAGTGLTNVQGVADFSLASPADGAVVSVDGLRLSWNRLEEAGFYRIEIETEEGEVVLNAILPATASAYRAPSWLKDRLRGGHLRWRVIALDREGKPLRETLRRSLRIEG